MRELIICACLFGCFGVAHATAPVEQPKEVKVIHNDDSVALHRNVYKLEQRVERLEKLLAEKEGK